MILRNIMNQKERLLTALWMGGEVNVKDLETIITPKYLPNLLYRLDQDRLIKRKRYSGIRTVSLSDRGIEFVCRKYGLFSDDSPSGDLYEKTVGKDETVRKQRRARGFISFSNAGVFITNDASRMFEETKEPFYVDSYELKKSLGPEVQGSRVSGIYLTKGETFRVYSTDGLFQIFDSIEERLVARLRNTIMRNNEAARKINDIVLCHSIEDMAPFVNNNKQIGKNGAKLYAVTAGDTCKYFIPSDNCKRQLSIITDENIREKKINDVLSKSLGVTVSNKEFSPMGDGYVVSVLDLNLGTIRKIMEHINIKNAKPLTVIWHENYESVFIKIFKDKVNYVSISDEQLEEIIGRE